MREQVFERDDLQGGLVGRFENDRRSDPCEQSLTPPVDAQAPAVSRSQTSKAQGRNRSDQVVALGAGERQELRGDPSTYDMTTVIAVPRPTTAVSIKSRRGIETAGLKGTPKNVLC